MTKASLHNPGGIPPLAIDIERTVRFEELDPMGIMWHGRYAGWLEDGREALGRRYGISYADFFRNEVAAPVKRMALDYRRPLMPGTTYVIHTELLWSDAARIDYRYAIRSTGGCVMTTAETTQLFTDRSGLLLLAHPAFYAEFMARWKSGTLQ